MMRRGLIGCLFAVGVVGSVATSGPVADVSGVSESETASLSADQPSQSFSASATLQLDGEAVVTSGEIGLTVSADGDVPGSFSYTLSSGSDESSGDVVDTEAQGQARIGVSAFSDCTDGCTEELVITFDRTDEALEGDLNITWSLDGFASTDVEGTTGTIDFTIE